MDPMIPWSHILMFVEACRSDNLNQMVKTLQEQRTIRIAQANSLEKAITGLRAKYGEEDCDEVEDAAENDESRD